MRIGDKPGTPSEQEAMAPRDGLDGRVLYALLLESISELDYSQQLALVRAFQTGQPFRTLSPALRGVFQELAGDWRRRAATWTP